MSGRTEVGPICGNEDCSVSKGICGSLTFGSGDLDDNGYWENPCVVCSSRWREWDAGEDAPEVWPEPLPILSIEQIVRVLEHPMGQSKKDDDVVVKEQRTRLHKLYQSLRTTNNRNRSDKQVLTDISNCTSVAKTLWLEEQFKLRGWRED